MSTDLETALRDTLAHHAALSGGLDATALASGARRRAGRIRRGRQAATGALAVAAVAVAVALPLSLDGSDRSSVVPAAPPSGAVTRPAPTSGPPVTAAPPAAESSAPAAGTDAQAWPFRGDVAIRDALLADASGAFVRQHPGSSVQPLWAGTTPQGGWSGLIFRATVADRTTRLGVWIAHPDGSNGQLRRDDVLEPGTTEIDQQLPADPSNILVVLGAPGTERIGYAPTVDATVTPEATSDGVAVFGLDARGVGNGVEYLELHDASGTLTYRASLSAGGFLAGDNVPTTSVRELVMNGLLQAWRAGDRAAATQFATPAAVTQMFAIPRSLHFVGGDCTNGPTPATCYPNGRELTTQPGLLVTVDGGASAGYQVTAVAMGSE